MFRLIVIFSFAFLWSTVNCIARCPFPGSTAGASFKFTSLQNRPFFNESETVEYECKEHWRPLKGVQYSLTCQRDGSWNGRLPVCGNLIFILLTKMNKTVQTLINLTGKFMKLQDFTRPLIA
jgi:hypothetical protein